MIQWFESTFVDSGRLALFLCFLAFVVTFLVTRVITRMIRAGKGPFGDNVSDTGLHVHHAVPGVVLLVVGAFLAVGAAGATGWAEVAGILVGIGTSLVLDEFALILRLDDVYWSEEGRVSVEMVALAMACLALVLLGTNPVQVDTTDGTFALAVSIVALLFHGWVVAMVVRKGKYRMALFGAFLPFVALFGAVRLARPTSGWARRRYGDDKMRRATIRAAAFDARWGTFGRWASDLVAGSSDRVRRTNRRDDGAMTMLSDLDDPTSAVRRAADRSVLIVRRAESGNGADGDAVVRATVGRALRPHPHAQVARWRLRRRWRALCADVRRRRTRQS